MRPKKKTALRLLANQYLAAVGSLLPDRIICPLCLKDLPFACMTEAHAPAEALMPTDHETWACSACNGRMNDLYERTAIPFLKPLPSATIRRLGQPRDEAADCRVTAYTAEDGNTAIRFDPPLDETKRPAYVAMIEAIALDSPPHFQITYLRREQPDLPILEGAIVSWFWFRMFSRLGYRSVLSPQVEPIRLALLNGGPLPCQLMRGPEDWEPLDQLLLYTDDDARGRDSDAGFIGWGFAIPPFLSRAVGPQGRPHQDRRPFFVVWAISDSSAIPGDLKAMWSLDEAKAIFALSVSRTSGAYGLTIPSI